MLYFHTLSYIRAGAQNVILFLMNILYVDDDQDDCFIFCEAVTEVDPSIKCTTANMRIEALQLVEKNSFEVIMLDFRMSGMEDGLLIKEIMQSNKYPSTAIIVYSTYMNDREIEKFKHFGAHDCITKPGDFNAVCDLVRVIALNHNNSK